MKWLCVLIFLFPWGGKKGQPSAIRAEAARLRAHVDTLTAIRPFRNHQNVASLDLAADHIRRTFARHSERVEDQPFRVDGETYRNVIASFGPESGERLIVGAHYDVCGDQSGADDNASGVAGLLELARLLDTLKPELRYRVDLVAYSLEEPPYFRTEFMGSYVHAKSLSEAGVPLRGMLSLEMIGYFSDEEDSQGFPSSVLKLFYPSVGNFIMVIGNMSNFGLVGDVRELMMENTKLPVHRINAPALLAGIDFSDHLNYWKFGYDAAMINDTAFLRNRHYHKPTDTPEKLDYDRMAEVVNGVYWAAAHL